MLTLTRTRELFPRAYIPINPNASPSIKALTQEERKEKAALAKKRREHAAALRALQLPFIFTLVMPECESLADLEEEGVSVTAIGPMLDDDPVFWTVDEIVQLHSVLLYQSIKALRASGNPREKLDVLEWMFAPDLVGEVLRQTPMGPRMVRVNNRDVAFSFAFCCRLEGHDPETYRSFFRREMPEAVSRFFAVVDDLDDVSYATADDKILWL